MKFEKIELSGGAWLDAYIADGVKDFTRRALLVIPGGGYWDVCSEREGEPIAMAFLPHGYNAFVLHYTTGRKKPFPTQLLEAAEAIARIKARASEYGHREDEVFVVGFSAGGHLAASTAVHWKHPAIKAAGIDPRTARPSGVMLSYPVTNPASHLGSHQNLWCTDTPTEAQLNESDVTRHVDGDTPPAFFMHTSNDQLVDVRGALAMAAAYRAAGVLFEMHIYPDAPHGAALGNKITRVGVEKFDNPAIARWVADAAAWADAVCAAKDEK
jgi:acetyl esterase/lipase